MSLSTDANILALDVGSSRIGVALANSIARLAHPLLTINVTEQVWEELDTIIKAESIGLIVVGLPRNLNGDATDQTGVVETFVETLKTHCALPVYLQVAT